MTTLLDPALIAAMRATAVRALPDLATIERAGAVISTGVPCRIGPIAGGNRRPSLDSADGDRIVAQSIDVVTFAAGQNVAEADLITIDSTVHEVTGVRGRASWEITRRVDVRSVDAFTNALLLAIRGPAAIDGAGDPTGIGTSLWTGSAAGYLRRSRHQTVDRDLEDQGKTDTLTILGSAGAAVLEFAGPDWEATTVLVEDRRTTTPVQRWFTVTGMEYRADGGVIDSVHLELSGEIAP